MFFFNTFVVLGVGSLPLPSFLWVFPVFAFLCVFALFSRRAPCRLCLAARLFRFGWLLSSLSPVLFRRAFLLVPFALLFFSLLGLALFPFVMRIDPFHM